MNPLIHGKSPLEHIVSIEPMDDILKVFQESPQGIITELTLPNRYWILSNKSHDKNWVHLNGHLHYCWGKQYTSREKFEQARQYLRKYDIYSIYDPKEANMVNTGITYFKGLKVEDVSILSFDIESTSLEHNGSADVLLIANTYRKQGVITRKLFSYENYKNAGEMIDDWCKWVRELNPSILCGHNIVIYDLPYMNFIANRYGYNLDLGRDGSRLTFAKYDSQLRKDGSQSYTYNKVKVYGREIVDTFFLSIKYDIGRKYESYKLKTIIKHEGLEVQNRQFYDAEKIRDNYKDPIEWEKIKAYAEFDADDALALYDLMIPSFFYLTQSIPKSFQAMLETASGSQINSFMIRSYLQDRHSIPKASEAIKFEGAISLGNPGTYKHAFKVDVSSLYPSIILTNNLYDPDKDPAQNFLTSAKYFTEERLRNKKLAKETSNRHYKDLEQAEKIIINSFFGFLGSQGLNFNYPPGAAFITKQGREILTKAMSWATDLGFQIVNADTDSITISDGEILTEDQQTDLLKQLNSLFPSTISWEHDGYFPSVVVLKAKNYILKSQDGKLKIKGSALKNPNRQQRLQSFIKETIDLLLDNNKLGVVDLYHKYIQEILTLTDISGWTTKRTITKSVLNPERTNEQKVLTAIENEEGVQEGDKIWVYFDNNKQLKLQSQWTPGDHDAWKLIESLWKSIMIFETVIDKNLFIKYHLKTKRKVLDGL